MALITYATASSRVKSLEIEFKLLFTMLLGQADRRDGQWQVAISQNKLSQAEPFGNLLHRNSDFWTSISGD